MKLRFSILPALLCVFCVCADAADRQTRPDILLIMPDQMRGDCLSALGHPAVQTPQLDKLAEQGALFRRAYTTVPSCIPARYALLTGMSPQMSGVVGFRSRPIVCPTLPGILAATGYATALVGRSMHQTPENEAYGYQQRILGSTYVSGDDYDNFLRKVAPECGGIAKVIAGLGLNCNGWEAAPWPLVDHLHPTAWIVEQSRRIVSETPLEKPLFLTTSFYSPHSPLFPPKKYFDAYMEKNLPNPARGDWVDWKSLVENGHGARHRVLLTGDTLHRSLAGYFGLIEHIDDQIGPLIDAFINRSAQAGRPWLIVVTSDHGEMLGDHGYFRKCEPYEGSANIPLIIAASPELGFHAGLRNSQPVCLEDIMPTLCELAGIEMPKNIDGVSLAPTLRGKQQAIHPWLHFEHATCYSKEQGFHAITDGRFKYVWRPLNGREQLFDLKIDPKEERDLSKDADHQAELARWRSTLVKRLADRPEGFSDGQRLIPGKPYPPLHDEMRR